MDDVVQDLLVLGSVELVGQLDAQLAYGRHRRVSLQPGDDLLGGTDEIGSEQRPAWAVGTQCALVTARGIVAVARTGRPVGTVGRDDDPAQGDPGRAAGARRLPVDVQQRELRGDDVVRSLTVGDEPVDDVARQQVQPVLTRPPGRPQTATAVPDPVGQPRGVRLLAWPLHVAR
ncbi:hypothetical protein ACG83_29000 [Frankia sp. R43]|nr:hypothetical protein ACG83_29000 [Frankia sp. R43]